MNTFDIFMWKPPQWPEEHPAVIISHPDRTKRKDWVEVLACSSKRATRKAEAHEFILDEADGMDWPTLCKCDLIYAVPKSELKLKKGSVSSARQAPIIRALISAHGWAAIL